MVYYFAYTPAHAEDAAYIRFTQLLDRYAYLHELSPGKLLVAPACHIYNLRKALSRHVDGTGALYITPVNEDSFLDPAARGFIAFWQQIGRPQPPPTVEELCQLHDA